MNHEKNHDELNPEEREKFATLLRERSPAASLEARIISALKAKGLIRLTPSPQIWTMPRLAGAFAVALVFLALGFGLGKWRGGVLPQQPHHNMFVLFLYDDSPETLPDDMSKVVEYGNWARAISMSKRMITGEKLKDGGRLLRNVRGQLEIREVREAGESNVLGGYFLIEAENYEEAIKVAASCPHLKYGGLIELRQIDQI
ncbi:YciI family protein [candidate division KSB1 bacterium]|nr:YciI family protein [candidate division KSB1 bacterium]